MDCLLDLFVTVLFKSSVYLLNVHLDIPPIVESGTLKCPTNTVLLSTFPFRSVNVCFMYLGALMLGVYILWGLASRVFMFIVEIHVPVP